MTASPLPAGAAASLGAADAGTLPPKWARAAGTSWLCRRTGVELPGGGGAGARVSSWTSSVAVGRWLGSGSRHRRIISTTSSGQSSGTLQFASLATCASGKQQRLLKGESAPPLARHAQTRQHPCMLPLPPQSASPGLPQLAAHRQLAGAYLPEGGAATGQGCSVARNASGHSDAGWVSMAKYLCWASGLGKQSHNQPRGARLVQPTPWATQLVLLPFLQTADDKTHHKHTPKE